MKLRIDNEVMVDEFFSDTRLLGIVAPIEQYRFCWHLNQTLNFDFRINNNIEIQLNKKARKYKRQYVLLIHAGLPLSCFYKCCASTASSLANAFSAIL